MAIDNYKKNKFYYFFHNNTLVKREIVEQKNHKELNFTYKDTIYNIEDRDTSTHIVDENNFYDCDLKKFLPRKDWYVVQDLENGNHQTFLNILEEIGNMNDCFSLSDVRYFHSKIVQFLENKHHTACKCCNPNLNSPEARALCDNCKNLFEELDFIKEELNGCYKEDNDFGKTEFNYKKFLYDIKFDSSKNYKKVRQKRKNKLLAELNKINKKIESSNYYITKDRHDKIKNSINIIRDNLISKSFDY